MWCADPPTFVGCLGHGQVFIFSPSGYKHTASETIGLNDCGVSRMDLAHKRGQLTCGHYVPLYSKGKRIASKLQRASVLSWEKNTPKEGE